MKEFNITANGKSTKTVLVPDGRHEVTIEKWNEAYKWMEQSAQAEQLFEDGDYEKSQMLLVESMCGTMEALSTNLLRSDLMQMDFDKVNNLFLMQFAWLTNESPKKNFKIKGKKFSVPNFKEGSIGDFYDAMSTMQKLKENEDADRGVVIAAVYMRQGEYYQDLQEIDDRIEFLKEHGRMDLFYSCAFFFLNSLKKHKGHISPPSHLVAELERLTSHLNGWATILYSQIRLKQGYLPK
jgi:hypothetical protein